MATVRALRKDSVSLSTNFFEYFFCCFSGKRGNDQSKSIRRRENETEDIADYGSNGNSERQQTTSRPAVDGEDDADDFFDEEATRRNENDNDDDDDDDDAGLDSDALEPKSSTPVCFRPTGTHSKSPSRSNKSNASGAGDDSSVIEAIRHSPSHDENLPEFPSNSVSRRAVDKNDVSSDEDSPQLQVLMSARRSKSEIDRMEGKIGGLGGGGGGGGIPEEEERKLSVVSAFDDNSSLPGLQAAAAEAAAVVATCTTASHHSHDTSDSNVSDISDLPLLNRTAPSSASRCGSVRMSFAYNDLREKMTVTVHEALGADGGGGDGATRQTQIRMLLLPLRKIRQKTKLRPTETPQFEESFDFRVPQADLGAMGLRIRLYGCERLRRETIKGEAIVNFSSINTIDPFHTLWIDLEPPGSLGHGDSMSDVSSQTNSDNSSVNPSIHHVRSPELMIGLAYNGSTGHLSVEVLKGTNFRNTASKRQSDTFVKLTLVGPHGREMTSSKTSVRRGQENPVYKETFVFQIAQSQLTDVSLMVAVFVRKSFKTKEMFGWFTMGQTNSSGEDQGHWTAMINSKGQQVCQRHSLMEP